MRIESLVDQIAELEGQVVNLESANAALKAENEQIRQILHSTNPVAAVKLLLDDCNDTNRANAALRAQLAEAVARAEIYRCDGDLVGELLKQASERSEKAEELLRSVVDHIGWRGKGEKDRDIFYCEHCDQSNEDWTLIEHTEGCVVRIIRAHLADHRPVTQNEKKESEG